MLRRYRKKTMVSTNRQEDMPLSAAKIEDNTLFCNKTIVIYLLLSSSISLYLQGKQSLRKLSYLNSWTKFVVIIHIRFQKELGRVRR